MRRPSEAFLKSMTSLASMFNREITEEFLMAYWRGLHDLTDEEIDSAVNESLATSEFLPTVAAIRKHVHGTLDDQAELAFESFSRHVSYYRTVDFEDKAINATVRHLGGMGRVCDLPAEGEEFNQFYRKEFLKVYKMYASRGVNEESGAMLVGFHDSTNGRRNQVDKIPCVYDRRELPSPHTSLLELKSP